jgi:hypothetical protein
VTGIADPLSGRPSGEVAAELEHLRAENARLLRLLKLTREQAALPRPAQAGLFEAPPGPVHRDSPPAEKVSFFGALFAARADIYAVRFENHRTGRAGWVPATRGGFRKGVPHAEREYLPLTTDVLQAHLSGKTHIGLYPLLDGDRCWWLAADFDGGDAMIDALMYLKAARAIGCRWRWRYCGQGWEPTRGCSSPPRFLPRQLVGWARGCCGRRWHCATGSSWPATTGCSRPRTCSRPEVSAT